MRASVRLPPPPLSKAAASFARVLHRNVPKNIDVINVAWTPPPKAVCHALVTARVPPPIPPEHDNALIAWSLRLRRIHVLCAWAFSCAVEEFGEALLHEHEKLEGASISVMQVNRYGPLGRIHVVESDEQQAGLLARHIEGGRVPATVQPLVGPLPLTSLCSTFFSSARTVQVHMAPSTFGIRTPLQPEMVVPEPLIWVGPSDPDGRVTAVKPYPPLKRLTAAQRTELESKLIGKDESLQRLCTALKAEGRDAIQSLRDQHVLSEQTKLLSSMDTIPKDDDASPLPPPVHPTGVGAGRNRRAAGKK